MHVMEAFGVVALDNFSSIKYSISVDLKKKWGKLGLNQRPTGYESVSFEYASV